VSPREYPAKPYRSERGREKSAAGDRVRSFVAVFPPRDVLESILELQRSLQITLPGVRWVEPGNLHFTLRFFGDLGALERAKAAQVIDEITRGRSRFDVELHGVGVFSSWKHPRVVWVGCGEGSEAFADLGRALEFAFRDARLGKADKPFKPHLTLGRWRDFGAVIPESSVAACEKIGTLGRFTVEEVGLIESKLSPQGSTYAALHRGRLV